MNNNILKKMYNYEADIQEINDFLKVLQYSVEQNDDTYYLTNFVKTIQQKTEKFSENYEELNNQIWILIN